MLASLRLGAKHITMAKTSMLEARLARMEAMLRTLDPAPFGSLWVVKEGIWKSELGDLLLPCHQVLILENLALLDGRRG